MEDQQGSETKVLLDIHQTLHQAAERLSRTSVITLFDDERDRLTQFTVSSEHLQLDFSKQRLDEATLTTLHGLATEKT